MSTENNDINDLNASHAINPDDNKDVQKTLFPLDEFANIQGAVIHNDPKSDPDDTVTSDDGEPVKVRLTMPIETFADVIEKTVANILNDGHYVYQNIVAKKCEQHDNPEYVDKYALNIGFPKATDNDDGPEGITLMLDPVYEQFVEQLQFDTQEELDAEIKRCCTEMVNAYNDAYMHVLRQAKYVSEVKQNMYNPDYIMHNICVDLSDVNTLLNLNKTDLLTHPFKPEKGLVYTYVLTDHGNHIGLRMTSEHFKRTGLNIEDMTKQAIVNLNNKILNILQIEDMPTFFAKGVVSPDAPSFIIDAIANDIRNDMPEFDNDLYIVRLNDQFILSSAIVLSRTGMLSLAKRMGAKKTLQIIPSSKYELLIRNADDEITDIDDLTELIQATNEHAVKPKDILSYEPWLYDVITGELS